MMTDHGGRFRSEEPLEELASDVWAAHKAIGAMPDEGALEAWEQAVGVLHDFGKLAERLRNDALLLACTDALTRAEEELERVQDRLGRPESGELHPREEERLKGMLRRCDALSNAWVVMHDHDPRRVAATPRPDHFAELAILEGLRNEANEALTRYKLEIGLEA